MKLRSGGQTGVDRAALDAALELGIEIRGWCPEGRLAEDGTIPDRYPLTELPGGGYLDRTLKNVQSSDGTLIIYFGNLYGGTGKTALFCKEKQKPHLLVDATQLSCEQAAAKLRDFLSKHNIADLNVAGPRESENAQGYPYTKDLLMRAFGENS